MQIKVLSSFMLLLAVIFNSGCASIMKGSSQQILITSNPAGAQVTINGTKYGTTPGEFIMGRAIKYRTVLLEKQGYEPATTSIIADPDYVTLIIGNLFSWGLPGMLSDVIVGSHNDLIPREVNVSLQKTKGLIKSEQAEEVIPVRRDGREIAETLKQVKQLKEMGVLTEEEYNRKRKELADQL